MPAYHRVVTARVEPGPAGTLRSIARVDDWFHGFQVTLDFDGDDLVAASATSDRHPWSTCPGALASVRRLSGPADELGRAISGAPRRSTCVHVNDLVWLAAERHPRRHYEMVVTTREAELRRDGEPVLRWRLRRWAIDGTGMLSGLGMADPRWAQTLDDIGSPADVREAITVLRRGVHVATGYYELDWDKIEVGRDVPVATMAESCHTFSEPTVAEAVCLARMPDRRARRR